MDTIKSLRFSLEGFVLRKGRILKELTDIDYIIDEDKEEMKNWTDLDVITIANNFYKETGDNETCPWCILFEHIYSTYTKCEYCTYGSRHGKCYKDEGNTYSKIMSSLIQQKIITTGKGPFEGQGIIDVPKIKAEALYTVRKLYLELLKTHKFEL